MKKLFVILFLSVFALICFMGRYEYTKYPNGKIYQRINRFTGDVQIFCCDCKNECNWQKGNKCPSATRQQIIAYGYYNDKSSSDINGALKKSCYAPLSNNEIERLKQMSK